MSDNIGQYSFIPWYRKGLSSYIKSNNLNDGRASIEISLTFNSNSDLSGSQTISLKGPGDILNINPSSIIRTEPPNQVSNFEANYLPFVEFYEEDFPWRYTPLANPSDSKLKPWIMLLVLKESEFEFNTINTKSQTQSIRITSPIPLSFSPNDLWATAHVHVNTGFSSDLTTQDAIKQELANLLESNPDIAYSRVMSLRSLEKNTKYYAFLVPTFERGRKAGLLEDLSNITIDQPSWTVQSGQSFISINFPYYLKFEFGCSDKGDFENLARLLKPVVASEILKMPSMDISSMNVELGSNLVQGITQTLEFIGAYQAPDYNLQEWPDNSNLNDQAVKNKLRERINSSEITDNPIINSSESDNEELNSEDPIVNNPPFYGQGHTRVKKLDDDGTDPSWLDEINLHPTFRAVAGLGTKVIQKDQEKFMDEVWGQLGEILEANKLLRNTQLAIEVNKKILKKHIESRPDEDILANTERIHSRIKIAKESGFESLKTHLQSKTLSGAAVNSGLRKLLRPRGNFSKRLQINDPINNSTLVKQLNDSILINVTGSRLQPKVYTNITNYSRVTIPVPGVLKANEVSQVEAVNENIKILTDKSKLIIPDTKNLLTSRIHPLKTLGEKTLLRLKTKTDVLNNGRIEPVMVAPNLDYPMYESLKNISSEFIIPGLSGVKNNSIFIMEPNRKFIEAYMGGLNHEMAKELIWRDYPTDGRATVFRKFWNDEDNLKPSELSTLQANDSSDLEMNTQDIKPVNEWRKILGANKPENNVDAGLVVVVRGDLLRKFPNTLIFAQRAVLNPSSDIAEETSAYQGRLLAPLTPENLRFPIFKTQLEPDITIIGFELTPEDAKGETDEGWFFVFKERLGQARFGLDTNTQGNTNDLDSWNDLSWADVLSDTGPFIDLGLNTINPTNSDSLTYGVSGNSAHMAAILYQVPAQVGIHASDLLNIN